MEQTGHFNCSFNEVGIIKKKKKTCFIVWTSDTMQQKLWRNTSLENLIKPNKFRKNINAWAQYQK